MDNCVFGEDSPPVSWSSLNDSLSNYSFLFPFEKRLITERFARSCWLKNNWTISLWGFCIYVIGVFVGEKLMTYKDRPFDLRKACVTWNVLAAVFSITGVIRTSPELFRVLSRHGFLHSVCQSTYMQDAVFSFWIEAFVFSKFLEFGDTAFLILRKRPVIFLHWYHHGTVLVFCWHGASTLTAAGRWFCWMNYCVHSVLYTYFALRTYGYRCPKWVSMTVTTVQMSQMVVGCWIGYVVYRAKSQGHQCHQTVTNMYMALGIYSTFLLLFIRYFYNTYLRGVQARRKGSTGNPPTDTPTTTTSRGGLYDVLKHRVNVRGSHSESG